MKIEIDDMDDISDVKWAVMEIYHRCPHIWSNEEIIDEIRKAIKIIKEI